MKVVNNFLETGLLPNLDDNLLHRVCRRYFNMIVNTAEHASSLKMTPRRVKMINCEIIRKVKYRAMTARSSLECVRPPMY